MSDNFSWMFREENITDIKVDGYSTCSLDVGKRSN